MTAVLARFQMATPWLRNHRVLDPALALSAVKN
jgi:hypothetical protein